MLDVHQVELVSETVVGLGPVGLLLYFLLTGAWSASGAARAARG